MIDYTELKRLAEAATAGPWKTNTAGSAKRGEPYKITEIYVYAPDTQDDTAICADVIDPVTQEPSEVNAAYIAAASPDVTLQMIAEIDRLRLHIKHIGNDALRTQNQALLAVVESAANHHCLEDGECGVCLSCRARAALAGGGV